MIRAQRPSGADTLRINKTEGKKNTSVAWSNSREQRWRSKKQYTEVKTKWCQDAGEGRAYYGCDEGKARVDSRWWHLVQSP
jgi:hypothetical protein